MIDNIGGKLAENIMTSLKKAGVSNQFCLKFSLHLICKLVNIIFFDEVRTWDHWPNRLYLGYHLLGLATFKDDVLPHSIKHTGQAEILLYIRVFWEFNLHVWYTKPLRQSLYCSQKGDYTYGFDEDD